MQITYPLWFIFIDYILGTFMWLFILKFILSLFFSEKTKFKFVLYIYNLVNKVLDKLYKFTPNFLPEPIVPLFFCWIFFLIRFYILPIFSGLENIGYLSFSIENHIFYSFEYYFLNRI